MKRALSWLFLTLFLFSVLLTAVSCDRATPPTMSDGVSPTEADSPEEPTEEPTEAPTEEPEEPDDLLVDREYRIVDSLDRFKFFGNRMTTLEDGVTCDFTASGIEFHGFMAGKVLLSLTCDRNTYFTVFINGERVEERMLVTPDTHEIILADLPVAGEYSIRVLKQTEPQWSPTMLYGVSLFGTLYEAPEDREYYKDFYYANSYYRDPEAVLTRYTCFFHQFSISRRIFSNNLQNIALIYVPSENVSIR